MPTQIINVLLIEDDAVDAEAIERALTQQEQGFSIEWVNCLQEGIDLAHIAEVDIILTDLRLPDADGLESVRALRLGYPHVPIIALTGADESIGLLTIRAGASDFLPKEKINRELLNRSIDYALERHRMRFELQRTNRELVGKNQKLAHVSRLSERFVSNVARQFLDPLESICEQSDQLRNSLSEQLAPQNLIMLNQLAEATDRLAGIARNLIDSNQFGSGEISVHRRSTSISEIIEQPLASLQEMVEGKQIDLQVAYPDDKQSASVFCDAQQVQRLLYNLIHNAIKFTPESGQIMIKVKRIGHQVRISVSDSGFGIPQEHQSLIFERFEQFAINKHTKTSDGLGLGLSVAKRLSETNLGSLTVQSQVGCGSQFTLLLPADDSHAALKCYLDQRTEADDEDGEIAVFGVTLDWHDDEPEQRHSQELGKLLCSQLSCRDLVLQTGPAHWIVYAKRSRREVHEVGNRLHTAWKRHCLATGNQETPTNLPAPELICSLQQTANVLGDRPVLENFLFASPAQ